MVNHAKEYGIKPHTRAFNTNVRWYESGLEDGSQAPWRGCEDQSRAPKNPLIKIAKPQRNKVIELKNLRNTSYSKPLFY